MTDRVNALVVTLDKEYRTDDVEAIVNAIKMVKGVIAVDQNVSDMRDHIAQRQARNELLDKIADLFKVSP